MFSKHVISAHGQFVRIRYWYRSPRSRHGPADDLQLCSQVFEQSVEQRADLHLSNYDCGRDPSLGEQTEVAQK